MHDCLCVVQGCFVLKGQSCTVAAQVAGPTELKMITNWSFLKEVAPPCASHTLLLSVPKIQPAQPLFLELCFQVFLFLEFSSLVFRIVLIFLRSR